MGNATRGQSLIRSEEDGVPYLVIDPSAELLAITLFNEYMKLDATEATSWIEVDASTREFYRQMARGEIPLIRP